MHKPCTKVLRHMQRKTASINGHPLKYNQVICFPSIYKNLAKAVCGDVWQVRGRAAQRRSEAAAQSSQGGVVKALLAARAAGEIAGIHGRLGVHCLCAHPHRVIRMPKNFLRLLGM